MCRECYAYEDRITPLLNPKDCLRDHTQYICGTCGRCICMEREPKRGLQRWNFPFTSLEQAKLYLRTADFTMKKSCGIYELKNTQGRVSYKIFPGTEELQVYLKKNQNKRCETMLPVFSEEEYREYPNTRIRRLEQEEIERYLQEKNALK